MIAALRRAIFRAPALSNETKRAEEWWSFEDPVEQLVARSVGEVSGILARTEEASRNGLWVAGVLDYEAAPAFDAALRTLAPESPTVAAFSLFPSPRPLSFRADAIEGAKVDAIEASLSEEAHSGAIAAIREAIGAGEVYQVNFTFPVSGRLSGEPEALFRRLAGVSRAPHAAFLDLGYRAVVSLSPELFFELDGERIAMRPMKGTRPRGRFAEEDRALATDLRESEKDRAENLMIVDMARNDLGKIAAAGSVRVSSLYDVERYPSVWQMTSTVGARTDAPLPALFAALFPCASVTGAPKPRAMRWIERLEREPRGVYCGAIGWVAPAAAGAARRARFSVAIRTATIDRATSKVTYGVGSGVVWDSEPRAEYEECLTKARSLADPGDAIELIETMRWSPRGGIRLLERHLARLAASADYFDLPLDMAAVREAIAQAAAALVRETPAAVHRLRLQLRSDGTPTLTSKLFDDVRRTWRAVVAAEPVSSSLPLLFHKTTRREVYDRALAEVRSFGADEVILWNERGELSEGSRTNLVLRIGGRWLTPARECGLLAGVMRSYLLDRSWIAEAVLKKEDLLKAERAAFVSALRGGIRFELA